MSGIGQSTFSTSARFMGEKAPSGRGNTLRYPSPWWDLAHMRLPTTVKHLFQWCRYHAVVNPLVASVVRKMAAYPVTDIVIDAEDSVGFDKHIKRWEDFLFRVANIPSFQVECGLDKYTYGNCLVSIFYPFHKYLTCKNCKKKTRIQRLSYKTDWFFKNFEYHLRCSSCRHEGEASVTDEYYRSYRDIRLIRWNPADISIDHNPITLHSQYFYTPTPKLVMKVKKGDQSYLETLPHHLILAIKTKKPFRLVSENVFHFKAASPSMGEGDGGWGYPPILPALKDSFYLQQMKKANEAVLAEHMVPLDILFPASTDATSNPFTTINLSSWKSRIETEISKWRNDPNYKPIMPLPLGHQRIGGNGRALMLTQEIRVWSEHILAGMNVPTEFVFGGLSYSGSSVSLRMLENQFITDRVQLEYFLQHFLIPHVAAFMRWPEIDIHMKQFKMADDMQARQLLMSLNQMKKISDKTLLSEFDRDSVAERNIITQELRASRDMKKLDAVMNAQIQSEQQRIMSFAQHGMQEELQKLQQQGAPQQGAPGEQNVNVVEMAEAWAKKLANMDQQQQTATLERMKAEMPQLYQLVVEKMQGVKAETQEPLPEQRPPRRQDSPI